MKRGLVENIEVGEVKIEGNEMKIDIKVIPKKGVKLLNYKLKL